MSGLFALDLVVVARREMRAQAGDHSRGLVGEM
jgi:hypothetical protein